MSNRQLYCLHCERMFTHDCAPKPDVVGECKRAFKYHDGGGESSAIAAIRRYLELRGLPADPELEGK